MNHGEQRELKIVGGLFSALFLFVVLRNIGLYPSIMADEYLYNLSARIIPSSQANIPDYLYYVIYGATNVCGDGHLECARVLNAIFFFGAAPFIYSIARGVTTKNLALVATFFALIGPINSYTAYFTPESFYFFAFWAAAWSILKLEFDSTRGNWLIAGAILGLSALIKPHALLLLPGLTLYFLVFLIRERTLKATIDALTHIFTFFTGTLSTKFIIGYWAAGKAGLSLFGTTYGSVANSTQQKTQAFEIFQNAVVSIEGHALVLSLLIGLPLSLAIARALRATFITKDRDASWKVSLFSVIVLFNLIGVVAVFTASVAGTGFESVTRLHMRYYNFFLPMFFIIAAGGLSSLQYKLSAKWRLGFALSLGAAAIWAAINNMSPYTPSHFDSPELRGLQYNGLAFKVSASLLIISLLIWAFDQKKGGQIYFYLALPLWLMIASGFITLEQRARLHQDTYDQAGLFAKDYLSPNERDHLLVVGHDPSALYRTLYYLDSEKASLRLLPEGSTLDQKDSSQREGWVLAIGSYQTPEEPITKISMSPFSLFRFSKDITVDFRRSSWPGVLST
ncbi:MAG: hypothetical protein EBS79_14325, partial [Gammaproteobacteria bacterium]|nr:hypothetical protein [Gammaproteobacteria bacterium]